MRARRATFAKWVSMGEIASWCMFLFYRLGRVLASLSPTNYVSLIQDHVYSTFVVYVHIAGTHSNNLCPIIMCINTETYIVNKISGG